MNRSMFQVYVKESGKAFEFYKDVFNAKQICRYDNPDGTLAHSELDVYGQVLAVSELEDDAPAAGNTMQFCLHFGEGKEDAVKKIYDKLKDGAKIFCGLGKCEYSPLMTALTDKFGVNWCIFV